METRSWSSWISKISKKDAERPDFYILTSQDWKSLVEKEVEDSKGRWRVEIDEHNTPVWLDQVKNGKPLKGMGVKPAQVAQHREKWDKITRSLGI